MRVNVCKSARRENRLSPRGFARSCNRLARGQDRLESAGWTEAVSRSAREVVIDVEDDEGEDGLAEDCS